MKKHIETTSNRSRKSWGDLEPSMPYDSRRKRERKSMAYGCLWSLVLIAVVVLMAFWWKKEVRLSEAHMLHPHMVGNHITL